ncbi:MAG: hypothetical protein FJ308_07185 [Planctomycetes bacterium]|nr:hypothetical protein [Planctomycetota bacterium]
MSMEKLRVELLNDWFASAKNFSSQWDQFWFASASTAWIARVRVAVAFVSVMQFLVDGFWVPSWLAGDGWFDLETGRYFIGEGISETGSAYRWSLLFPFSSSWFALLVVVVGGLASLATMLGVGAKLSPLIAWACLLTIHHRAPWLTTPAEMLLAAGLIYLVIDPGRIAWDWRPTRHDRQIRVSANLAVRCIQVHSLVWLCFSIASMLQQQVWWNGTAVTMMSRQRGGYWGIIEGTSWLGQGATVSILALQFLGLMTLPRASSVALGYLAMVVLAGLIVVFNGDWMYALAILALTSAWVPRSAREITSA